MVGVKLPGRYTVRVLLENECRLVYYFSVDIERNERES
jgi:hypothetical protein